MLYPSDRLVTGMEVKCKIKHYYGDGTSEIDFALWNFGIQGSTFGVLNMDIWDPRGKSLKGPKSQSKTLKVLPRPQKSSN